MNTYIKIVERPKLKTSELLNFCRSKFKVWSWKTDKELDKNFPRPKKETTHYFLNCVEADEIHKNKSANDLKKEGIKGITLRERIIMELEYFELTGKHLDIDNITLCSGSRYLDGDVPYSVWIDDDGFCVDGCGPDSRSDSIRAREQFSSIPSNLTFEPLESLSLEKRVKDLEDKMIKIERV